jgi:sugar phosphate permease
LGIRAAIFFSAAALAGSFGGLLAAGIAQMKGIGGKAGWVRILEPYTWSLNSNNFWIQAWIFILEGLVTVIVGIVSYWMVHDFPQEATFLSDDDRARVIRRLKEDQQASAEHEVCWQQISTKHLFRANTDEQEFKMTYFWQSVTDWKTWCFAIIYMGADGALYAFSLFLPTIINALGYSGTTANLLSVPPYACAAVFTVVVGAIADRTQKRGLINVFVSLLGITGFIMLIASQNPHVKYAGTFLAALGIYP